MIRRAAAWLGYQLAHRGEAAWLEHGGRRLFLWGSLGGSAPR